MKKFIKTITILLITSACHAQSNLDTVSLGPSYLNQVWYSLENDEQGHEPKSNWDLAFDVAGFGTSIHTNSANGVMLWTYPYGDTAMWSAIDTTGIAEWTAQYNSDTTWSLGAADRGIVASIPYDVGWGIYNPITHIISGDSLFIIKLANGDYKKLWIINVAGGGYNFKYSDIDGNNLNTVFLSKSNYTGKNFAYYSIESNTEIDREPVVSAEWDLLFTQYTTFIPTPYNVAGVLSNKEVEIAQVDDLNDPVSYTDWGQHNMTPDINEIGYDWKAFTGAWMLEEDRVYFIRSRTGDIWKVIFTGFGGSGNGNYIFTKEKLSTVNIDAKDSQPNLSFMLYPNPSHSSEVNVAINLFGSYSAVEIELFDLSGRRVLNERLPNTPGFHILNLKLKDIDSGVYVTILHIDNQMIQKKLIIK